MSTKRNLRNDRKREEASERLEIMFPHHPDFASDIMQGDVYLYDASLFNNEDENLRNGIYNEPPKFRKLNVYEKKMVKEIEDQTRCKVFYVTKHWTERGLFYSLYFVGADETRWEGERMGLQKNSRGQMRFDTLEVNAGWNPEDLVSWNYRTLTVYVEDFE